MKERFEVLDIFRGIFASMVVLFHLSPFAATPILNNEFIFNCDLFVDFFFVLSGFVIAYTHQNMKSGGQLNSFFKKRFFRLYPLHFIILIVFVLIELSKHSASGYVHVNKIDNVSNNLETFLTNIFLVNSIKWPNVHDVSWNIVSWSISAEMIAYILFAFIVVSINRLAIARFRVLIYVLVIVIAGYILYRCTGGFGLMYSFDYGFLRGSAGFFTGVVCYNVFNLVKNRLYTLNAKIFTVFEVALPLITITAVCYGTTLKPYGFIYELLFFFTILIFVFEKGAISSLLKKSGYLRNAGKYSYSIYMTHTLLISLFNIVFFRALKMPLSAYAYMFILNYLIIYFVSAWTYKHIEMRFNKIAHKRKS